MPKKIPVHSMDAALHCRLGQRRGQSTLFPARGPGLLRVSSRGPRAELFARLFSACRCSICGPASSSLRVCDALAEGCNTTTQTEVSSYVAASRQHHASLGPAAFDFLTLGAMDASERTNITIISLPAPPCNGLEERKGIPTG